jgi:hypothetical protein
MALLPTGSANWSSLLSTGPSLGHPCLVRARKETKTQNEKKTISLSNCKAGPPPGPVLPLLLYSEKIRGYGLGKKFALHAVSCHPFLCLEGVLQTNDFATEKCSRM